MRLTVLGSGSSGNGYLLEGRDSALLLECGVRPEAMMRLTDIPVSKIAAAFVTLSVFVPRPYCRFACPTGTLFKLAEANGKDQSK